MNLGKPAPGSRCIESISRFAVYFTGTEENYEKFKKLKRMIFNVLKHLEM